MSLMGMVNNFIGQVHQAVNSDSNPLGLSAGQIDEINQILHLIKNLLSDGIQRNDVMKLMSLLGEMAEIMPEFADEIKQLVKELKDVSKKLFGDDQMMLNKNNQDNSLLQMESSLDETASASLLQGVNPLLGGFSNLDLGESSVGLDSLTADEEALNETKDQRIDIAERLLNFVNDNLVLSQVNFNMLMNGLNKIKNRASLQPEPVDDSRINERSSEFPLQ
ncbi:MAG: hypothetical protein VXX85_01885 [Candidatus Margulisiibacteriota bacterium]|nr:hypothetical protein [Candidatus Margulisiibacteriota bacterium]